jgi:hypothetical protein
MVRTEREMVGVYGPVILTTRPTPGGFIYKYLLGLTPLILVGLSLLALPLLHEMVKGFSPTLVDSLQKVIPDLPQIIEIFIWLGDVINRPEIWIGSGLTLLLSGAGALYMVQDTDLQILSTGYLLSLLQWVAYLVQPFSVVAAVVVIAGVEAFRRSLHYTLTRDVVIITGGIWNPVENVFPLHQIGRVVLVQGRLGHLLNFGTVVPAGKVFGLSETEMTGHHEPGDMLHPDTDQVRSVRWQKGSHNPLLSLYGILQPDAVKERIEKAIQKASEKDE